MHGQMDSSKNQKEIHNPDFHDQAENDKQKQMLPDSYLIEGRWLLQQHTLFLQGIMKLGKDWKQLQKFIKTRTSAQVRSHAQKYFIKLLKVQKERKKNRNKLSSSPTELQSEILQMFVQDDISDKTPTEIVAVIRRKFQTPYVRQGAIYSEVAKRNRNHKVQQKIQAPNIFDNAKIEFDSKTPIRKNSDTKQQTAIQCFLGANEDIQDSYFLSMIKNRNIQLDSFRFRDLIDFGHGIQENPFQHKFENQEQISRRKRSFTLYEQNQSNEKLQFTLEKVRKGRNNDEN